MRVLFVLLLSVPAWSRHIIEGPIGEISEATEVVARADRELADPQTTPERRAEAQAVRSGGVERISSVAASHPVNAEVNITAASSLLRINEPVRAEETAERAVVATPENPDAYLQRGRARLTQGKYDGAVEDFRAVLQRRPGDPAATAGLKLSEGRTSIAAGSVPAPQPAAEKPPAPAPTPRAAAGLSEFDRQATERKRIQNESISLYNASRIAQGAGDWQKAIDDADKALALAPNDSFLKRHLDAVRMARDEALRPKAGPVEQPTAQPKPLGSSDFMDGLFHYVGKSKATRRVDFQTVETSDVRVTDFRQVRDELAKPVEDERRLKINAKRHWKTKGSQGLLLGSIQLLLRGELTIRKDCRWTFDGSLRSFDDVYDFNKGKRGVVGETLTTMGRMLPGNDYDVEIRGVKSVHAEGVKEKCP